MYFAGYTSGEVARVLGETEAAIARRIRIGLLRLQAHIDARPADAEPTAP